MQSAAVTVSQERALRRRERILQLLAKGWLTQSEAAALTGVSRQRIHQWVQVRQLHPVAARARHINKLLRRQGGVLHD